MPKRNIQSPSSSKKQRLSESFKDKPSLKDEDDSFDTLDTDEEPSSHNSPTGSSIEDDEEEELPQNKATNQDKAAQRREHKQLQQERKLNKPHGRETHEIKQLWERLRAKTVPAEVRKKLVKQCLELCQNRYKELVFRHDSSRVVQTLFKYCDQQERLKITDALKGSYVELAKSSYGKYLLVKMLHYGSSATRKQILDELHGHFRSLMKHREGAYVIEDAFRDYATAAQKRQILREFYGSKFALFKSTVGDPGSLSEIVAAEPETRPYLMDNLKSVLTSAVSKGSSGFEIIHAAMVEYIHCIDSESERSEFVDLVTEQFAEMVHTKDGSKAASLTVAISTAKERKQLIKALKPFAKKLAEDQYGNLVLTAIFLSVDDTVLVAKTFNDLLKSSGHSILTNKYSRRPFLYILTGLSPRYFGKEALDLMDEVNSRKKLTSKKEDDVRRQELLNAFKNTMEEIFAQDIDSLALSPLGMQFVAEFIRSETDSEKQRALATTLASAFQGNPSDSKHPCQNIAGLRILKELVRNVPVIRSPLKDVVLTNPDEWVLGSGTFVVVSLLEHLEDKISFTKQISKLKRDIEKTKPKGGDVLLGLIKSQ